MRHVSPMGKFKMDTRTALAGGAVALVGMAWGIGHDPGQPETVVPVAEIQQEFEVGPVFTQREALDACTLYVDVQMEMDCRQAAFDTHWPENADGLEYPK